MATYSLTELTKRMQGKSVTFGWDAIVFMNREKVNSLLEQQYITKFNKNSFLKRISGKVSMVPDGKEYLQVRGLIMTVPRLSFQKASLRDSRVTATMDIVGGTVSYMVEGSNQAPPAILYSYVISEHQGKTLTMDIDLAESTGTVNQQGRVLVDIGSGYENRCNLVNEVKAQELLGDFFKKLFLEQKPEDRLYELGMLPFTDVSLIAPREFKIRTMATEDGKNIQHERYGEGAVVLFVRTKGNPELGNEPTEAGMDYMIPNDVNAQGKALYSGSLVLASRVVFDWYFSQAMEEAIGANVRFESTQSNFVARTLTAISGAFELDPFEYKWHTLVDHSHHLRNDGPLQFKLHDVNSENALRVFPNENYALELSLKGDRLLPFHIRYWNFWWGTENHYYNAITNAEVKVAFEPHVIPGTNVVTFVRKTEPVIIFTRNWDPEGKLKDEHMSWDYWEWLVAKLDERLTPRLIDLLKTFENIDIPEINTLLLSNLLFPERNALQLTHARLPGDLFMVGHIDPTSTTITLDPLMPVMQAGQKQTFTIRQLGYKAENVTWSVRGIDGERAVGEISNGEYTAPAAQLLESTASRNVVTATYTDPGTGLEITASALVVVTLQGVVVTPSMMLVDMANPKDVTMTATSLGAGPLKWTPLAGPGTLVPNGAEATFKPPQQSFPDGTLITSTFEVEDQSTGEKAIATVLLRRGDFSLSIAPALVPGLRPKETALLKAPADVPVEYLKWEVVAGEGSIDSATGVYTAPNFITQPYAVVKATLEDEFFDFLGYSIVYLSEHAKPSTWDRLDFFEFETTVDPTTVYANGLQQAKIVVRVKTADKNNQPTTLSPEEKASIRLVSVDGKHPLPQVGEGGVPPGGKWYYTTEKNEKFDPYPHRTTATDAEPEQGVHMETKEFFVQCHSIENLRIGAALTSDNYEDFFTHNLPQDGEENGKVKNLIAVQPPASGTIGGYRLTFGERDEYPVRVEGDKDNDNDLTTVDYYQLKLLHNNAQTAIRDVEFIGNKSMAKWESDTALEDVLSYTGWAVHGDENTNKDTILHFDDILLRRLGGTAPSQIVNPVHPVVPGQVLFSLNRTEYWRYDKYVAQDFRSVLSIVVTDRYGNKHPLRIGFKGTDRNELLILA